MPHNLSYPLDVEGDDQQGHYIMFMINETTPGKVSTGRPAFAGGFAGGILGAGTLDHGGPLDLNFIDTNLNQGSGKYTPTFKGAVPGSLHLSRPGTTRMSQAITLYMPPSVKVSYKSNYKNDEIGFVASGVATTTGAAIEAFIAESNAAEAGAKAAVEGTVAFLADKAMRLADTFAPGASTLAQLSAGAILGSKMELMFTDVGRRDFSFQFNFIPKSEQEAKMVYNIVQTFKEHMLPEYLINIDKLSSSLSSMGMGKHDLGQGRVLRIPDTFDIFYFFHNNENPFLNRISTCYLTSLDIDYGGEKYVTYEPTELDGQVGPPPQRTNITLAFTEIETITRERAAQGF